MLHRLSQHYVGGAWVTPLGRATMPVENPATGSVIGGLALGNGDDAHRAVMAARAAFEQLVAEAVATLGAAAGRWGDSRTTPPKKGPFGASGRFHVVVLSEMQSVKCSW